MPREDFADDTSTSLLYVHTKKMSIYSYTQGYVGNWSIKGKHRRTVSASWCGCEVLTMLSLAWSQLPRSLNGVYFKSLLLLLLFLLKLENLQDILSVSLSPSLPPSYRSSNPKSGCPSILIKPVSFLSDCGHCVFVHFLHNIFNPFILSSQFHF